VPENNLARSTLLPEQEDVFVVVASRETQLGIKHRSGVERDKDGRITNDIKSIL
jgi:hypothetical protein